MAVKNLTDVLLDEDVPTILEIMNTYSTLGISTGNKLLTQSQVVDSLLSTSVINALSAQQGSILKGLVDTNTGGIQANTADIASISEALANLSSSQGTIEDNILLPMTTVEAQIPFDIVVQSTDLTVFEFDGINDEIDMKVAGNYNWLSTITIESQTNTAVDITFKLVNVADDAILSSQTFSVELQTHDKETFPVNTLLVIPDGSEPITCRITATASATGMTLFSFTSLLAVRSSSTLGVVTDHDTLTGRSTADQHPTSAITGLDTALGARALLTTNTFTGVQFGTITAGDNALDLTVTNGFALTATAANITVGTMASKKGQEGSFTIYSAANVTGWGPEFRFAPDFNVTVPPVSMAGTMEFWYKVVEVSGVDGGTSNIIHVAWAK